METTYISEYQIPVVLEQTVRDSAVEWPKSFAARDLELLHNPKDADHHLILLVLSLLHLD